jgi:hypothetical protein
LASIGGTRTKTAGKIVVVPVVVVRRLGVPLCREPRMHRNFRAESQHQPR